MTMPEVDQELERLFSVAREATLPDAGARDRVRVALTPRLAASAPTAQRPWGARTWLGLGLAVLGAGAAALWLASGSQIHTAPAMPAPNLVPAPPTTPPAPRFEVSAPLAVGEPPPSPAPSPSPQLRKPTPSSTHDPDPAEELRLVRAMQQALRSGDAGRALTLASEHARRFPRGT